MSETALSPAPQKIRRPLSQRLLGLFHRLAYQTWNNPVVIKELRGRMRGWRAAAVLISQLVILSCFASFVYFIIAEASSNSGTVGSTIGQALFYSTYLLQMVMVVFLSPAFTAGAISGERERKTLELLVTTLLPTHSLVLGKLVSALAYIVLLILVALPIESLAFVFGGVVLPEVIIGTLLLLATALLSGAVGIFISSLMKSSIASTVLTYATILLFSMGLPIMLSMLLGFIGVLIDPIMDKLDWIGQIALVYLGGLLVCSNPFATAIATVVIEQEKNSFFFFTSQVTSNNGNTYVVPLISPWIVYILLYTVISGLLILISIAIIQRKRG